MTYVLLGDETARMEALRDAGKDGRALWYAGLTECAAAEANGVMTARLVKDAAYFAEVARPAPAARRLVEVGLWHDPAALKACGPCRAGTNLAPPTPSIPADAFLFHEWWVQLLDGANKKNPLKREHELRRKRLFRNAQLVRRIRERDLDLCRYCGVLTVWGPDHKSPKSGTLDHIDPIVGQNRLEDVVVACRRCNGRKKDRTPDQAGMVLLPEPDPCRISDTRTGSQVRGVDTVHATEPGVSATDPDRCSRDARDGTGPDQDRIGVGSGTPDPTPIEDGHPDPAPDHEPTDRDAPRREDPAA